MGLSFKKLLKGAKNFALPAIGFALGGPPGAALGGAAAGAIGEGKPKLKKIGLGAATGALTGGVGAGLVRGGMGAVAKQGLGGALGSGLKSLTSDPGRLLDLGLGGLSAYQGYQSDRRAGAAQKRANSLQDRALQFAEQQYAERAPMRKLGMDMALNQTPEDVSALYASDNPFARRRRMIV